MSGRGFVWLVGAGPGDVELITLKARRLIESADAIVHDALVPREALDWAPAEAERHDVGKRCGVHGARQDEICARLVQLARAGKRVVRLKGGDPSVFGRAGEELAALRAAGVGCAVVPGVTAALAAAAWLQAPLTDRRTSPAVVFVTGHESPEAGHAPVDWAAYAQLDATLCIYMGVRALGRVAEALRSGGRAETTPVAVVSALARPEQRVLTATLGTVDALVAALEVAAPAVIIIGEAVAPERWATEVLGGQNALRVDAAAG